MTDQRQTRHAAATEGDDDDARADFALLLHEKLLDADAPEPLMQLAADEAGRMAGQYRSDDPADIARLNSKLLHLLELTNSRPDPAAPFEAGLARMMRDILRYK